MKATIKRRKPMFVSPWTYDHLATKGSVTGGKSFTVPNQSMSVREIMIRFTRGVGTPSRQPVYDEDGSTPDFDRMDEMEKLDHLAELREQIRSYEQAREAQAANERGPLATSESDVEPSEEASARSAESADQVRPLSGSRS